jgi:CheY-like chemotaxis protein
VGDFGKELGPGSGGLGQRLLDISLARLDGREVIRRIRLRRRDLPVLMLTARDDTRNKVGALDAGADDYLTKPFVFEELLVRVRAHPPLGPGRVGADTDRRPHNRTPFAPRLSRRSEDRALQQGVRPAGVLYAPRRTGPLQAADTLRHLGLRLRTRIQRRRRVRAPPSKQSRSSGGTVPDTDRPQCRLPLQRRTKPLRIRRVYEKTSR